jgi:hypothetical protein
MPNNNLYTTIAQIRRAGRPLPFDLGLARRLVLRCESEAASAKSWAAILSSRLQSPKPITDAAMDVAWTLFNLASLRIFDRLQV